MEVGKLRPEIMTPSSAISERTAERDRRLLSSEIRTSVRALHELPVWVMEDLKDDGVSIPEGAQRCLKLMVDHARRVDQMLDGFLGDTGMEKSSE